MTLVQPYMHTFGGSQNHIFSSCGASPEDAVTTTHRPPGSTKAYIGELNVATRDPIATKTLPRRPAPSDHALLRVNRTSIMGMLEGARYLHDESRQRAGR